MKPLRILFLLLCSSVPAMAAEWQSLPAIQATVEAFVQEKLAAQPGENTFTVSRIDARLKLTRCDQPEPYLPSGNRLWGNVSVGVRCLSPSAWTIYVPVSIKVSRQVVVSARPISSGQTIQAEDVQLQQRDITMFAGSALTAPDQAIGKNSAVPVPSGTVLRTEMLRIANIIQQGQTVRLVAQGTGFRVSSEGTAMNNARPGQVVSIKTRSGQIIKGIAVSEGVVEVSF
ncbi:flagella basal body P-ring formation protein FlgA precursor [mine drainage metagenome]|uniref:Flagella basal body P-ring formation protein FlgA n=1 Tax=mine drainage metagenome TaxID=410659 RepID=A0A1J5QQ08_9ZZZZ